MRVLLVNPPYAADPLERRLGNYMPPLNLLYLAARLEKDGHAVKVLDLYAAPLSEEAALKAAADFGAELAGFATYSQNMPEVYALCRALKARLPGVRTILGGLYASFLPEECLNEASVDLAAAGEAEETLAELAGGADPAGIKGLVLRGPGGAVRNPPRPLTADLDSLPPPAWHLADLDVYTLPPNRAVTRGRKASVLTSRGCAYRCSFCTHHYGYGGGSRLRGVPAVLAEIELLVRNYGVKELRFEDCTFTADPARVVAICRGIRAAGLDLVWNCDVRCDTASDGLFAEMRAAGCRRVFIGVESASEKILNSLAMKKGQHLDQARRAVALARRHGLRVTASFVVGTPGETEETARETYAFALELDPDYAMFSALVPSVGSELFEKARREGKLDVRNYRGSHYLMLQSDRSGPVNLCEIPPARLLELMEEFNTGFYRRPRYMLRRLFSARSALELGQLFWGGLLVFRRKLPWVDAAAARLREGPLRPRPQARADMNPPR